MKLRITTTVAPGDDYTGGAAISGVFGGPPFPSTTYALRLPRQAAAPTCARSTPAWRAL